jgi:hydrophobic/amphiphilic exporter-1 (mainly G- bacteria), HAE1 family
MYISDFSIKRPMVTVVVMFSLVVFGLFALFNLKVDEFPDVQQPLVLVGIPYPGASPQGVEREVLDPVEEVISGISGVDQVHGTAADGFAQIMILFDYNKDMQEASQEIRDGISSIRADLPPEMEEPILERMDPADMPVISMTMSSERLTPAQLTQFADQEVSRALRSIQGVAKVNLIGGVERELTVEIRPDAMASVGVSMSDVVQALQAQNLAAPVGRLNGSNIEETIRLEGRLTSPSAFEDIIVAVGSSGRPVRLREVATVRDGAEEQRSLALFNGEEAIGIDIIKTRNYSTTSLSDAVRQEIVQIQTMLPEETTLEIIRDSGINVSRSVWSVEQALIEGALLTVLVVFLFLNSWRSTVITGLALPVSVIAAFIAVWVSGFTLNIMSLLGLSLAIGILIDDAIVVRENIVRHVEMGKTHLRAAHEGTAEIGLAVAATTFSIIAVFVPIAFMPGVAGQWFKPFALTIAASVLVSLFVSFSLDPMLSAYWADPHRTEDQKGFITKKLDRFNAWFNRLSHGYRGIIGWALDHPKSMVALAAFSFFGALALPATGLVGSSFFGTDDRSELSVTFETEPGSSLSYTRGKVEDMLEVIRKHPEVQYTYATIGDATGQVDVGSIYVKLNRPHERDMLAEEFGAMLRDEVAAVEGVKPSVYTNSMNQGYKQIQIQVRGTDPVAIQQAADMVLAQVQQVPNAVDIGLNTRGQKPELKISIDRDQAAAKGISTGQIAQALRPAFAGLDAGDWVDPDGETRDVVVRLAPEYRQNTEDLNWLPLRSITGSGPAMLPLWEVAQVESGRGPALIRHLDRDNVIVVEANVAGGIALSEVLADINTRIEQLQLPEGVRVTQGGEVESQTEVFTDMFLALITGVMLMYLILVLQFGSFLDPLPIMMSLPLSLIGVMLGLLVSGHTINLMSLIGVILLMGIVAKNAILLIDFAKSARKQGMSRREALIEAGAIRLRPILMTTMALIAGMIPVALGGGEGGMFRQPLGVAVIGGTITSTFLTLLVIPVAYEIVDEWREWAGRIVRRFRKPHKLHEPSTGDGSTVRHLEPA